MSGLLLVVVHGGEKLLAMDDDGFSDPYCIMAANREKVRYIMSAEWNCDIFLKNLVMLTITYFFR